MGWKRSNRNVASTKAVDHRKDGSAQATAEASDRRAIEPSKAWFDQAGDADARNVAIRSIGKIGGPAAADILLEIFANNPDKDARRTVVVELGRLGDERAIEVLTPWLDAKVHPDDRHIAIHSIREIGSPAAIQVLLQLFTNPPNQHTRNIAAAELACTGDPSIHAQLLRYYRTSRAPMWKVVSALGELGDQRAAPFLRELLSDKLAAHSFEDTCEMADVLGKLRDPHAVPLLCKMVDLASAATLANNRGRPGHSEFMHAVEALEQIGDPSALPTLRKIRADAPVRDERVKWAELYRADDDRNEALVNAVNEAQSRHDALERAKATLKRRR